MNLPMNLAMILALMLAFAAGFAVQRGSICTVSAVRAVIEGRRWSRFLSFLECAAWALAGLLILEAAGVTARATWPAGHSWPGAVVGGALFGTGAVLNGTCAFGSVGRLASGDTSFLAFVLGFLLGAALPQPLLEGTMAVPPVAISLGSGTSALLAGALGLFAAWRLWTAWRAAPTPRRAWSRLADREWPDALAMAIIALVSVGLSALVASWPYTNLLVDLAVDRRAAGDERILLALIFFLGAVAGAATRGDLRLRAASAGAIVRRLAGGGLMGFGALLIPGGNDSIVLVGIPLLQPEAMLAYLAIILAIAAGLLVRRLRPSVVRRSPVG